MRDSMSVFLLLDYMFLDGESAGNDFGEFPVRVVLVVDGHEPVTTIISEIQTIMKVNKILVRTK